MTTLTINLTDAASDKQANFNIDTNDARGRLFVRWLTRALPGQFDLAKHVYPDDVLVFERLGDTYDPVTVTRCKSGIPNLIFTKRHVHEQDDIASVSNLGELADYWAEEDAKQMVFDNCCQSIRDRLDALKAGTGTGEELREEGMRCITSIENMLGKAWLNRLLCFVAESREEAAAW